MAAALNFHKNDFDYEEFASKAALASSPPSPSSREAFAEAAAARADSSDDAVAWDAFYSREAQADPYRPRRYLIAEFPELLSPSRPIPPPWLLPLFQLLPPWLPPAPPLLFDIGCGYGSALMPLLRANSRLCAVAVDLSPTAVARLSENLRDRALFSPSDRRRVRARPWDITKGLPPPFSEDGARSDGKREFADLALLIFTLSAVAPTEHVAVLRRLRSALRPGSGTILFRDRARFDLTMIRASDKQRLGESTYAREDGTLAHYFTADEVERLAAEAGLEVVDEHGDAGKASYCTVRLRNRRKGTDMHRCFVHARLRRPLKDGGELNGVPRTRRRAACAVAIFAAAAAAAAATVFLARRRRG